MKPLLVLLLVVIFGSHFAVRVHADEAASTDDFRRYYSQFLAQLDEPRIWENCSKSAVRYRVLQDLASSNRHSIRVEIVGTNPAIFVTDFQPPDQLTRSERKVTIEEWSQFQRSIAASYVWKMKPELDVWGIDTGHIYVEYCVAGNYKIIKRRPHDQDVLDLLRHFEALT